MIKEETAIDLYHEMLIRHHLASTQEILAEAAEKQHLAFGDVERQLQEIAGVRRIQREPRV